MNRAAHQFINAMHWLALTLWVACIIGAAVAAMGVFSTLPKVGVIIPDNAAALGDDPAVHGRVAGGMIMEPIFTATDWAQTVAAVVVIITAIVQFAAFGCSIKKPAHALRVLCIVAAAALLAIHLFAFTPRMNRNLREYWKAIDRNDQVAMTERRDAFNADHVLADRLIRVRLFVLLGAVAMSGIAFSPVSSVKRQ